MMESRKDWDHIRGGYLDWAALCPRKFCAALGYSLEEFKGQAAAWAASERARKYGLAD